jgi:hypothetical protein
MADARAFSSEVETGRVKKTRQTKNQSPFMIPSEPENSKTADPLYCTAANEAVEIPRFN